MLKDIIKKIDSAIPMSNMRPVLTIFMPSSF